MGSRLDRVIAWLDVLRTLEPSVMAPHLSEPGARAALDAALNALTPLALADALDRPGTPFERAAMVVARTVFTAPLEWAAVLLARGTALTLKPASTDRAFVEALVATARDHDLPLTSSDDRAVVTLHPLVVAMGSDATIEAVRRRVDPGARFLGFGHRFGAAYLTTETGFAAVGPDLALHDGLGCMSPVALFTPWPVEQALAALAATWRHIDARWPAGPTEPGAGAAIREREALARVLGRVAEGASWSIHALPIRRFRTAALPRSVALHAGVERHEVEALLHAHRDSLSTLATDDLDLEAPAGRVCAPGQMQRPPLDRLHDGVDWLAETLR